jgi:hypothetical protein
MVFCENSALRRDWCSSAHLLEGLGPHVSDPGWPKWLPQAPLKTTTQNSAYRRDWRSPGRPYYLKVIFLLRRRAHFQQRVFLHVFILFG